MCIAFVESKSEQPLCRGEHIKGSASQRESKNFTNSKQVLQNFNKMHGKIDTDVRISILELEFRLSSLSTGSSVDFDETPSRTRANSEASSRSTVSRNNSFVMEKYPRSLLEEEELSNTVEQSLLDLGSRAQIRRRVGRSKSLSISRKAVCLTNVERSFSAGSYDFRKLLTEYSKLKETDLCSTEL